MKMKTALLMVGIFLFTSLAGIQFADAWAWGHCRDAMSNAANELSVAAVAAMYKNCAKRLTEAKDRVSVLRESLTDARYRQFELMSELNDCAFEGEELSIDLDQCKYEMGITASEDGDELDFQEPEQTQAFVVEVRSNTTLDWMVRFNSGTCDNPLTRAKAYECLNSCQLDLRRQRNTEVEIQEWISNIEEDLQDQLDLCRERIATLEGELQECQSTDGGYVDVGESADPTPVQPPSSDDPEDDSTPPLEPPDTPAPVGCGSVSC